MIAHIYPSVLQVVSRRGYAGYLDGCFQGCRSEAMQDLGYELPRIPIPRTRVNRGPWAHLRPLSILAVRRSVGEVDDARLECLRVHKLQRFRVAPFLKEALAASHYDGMDHEPQFV